MRRNSTNEALSSREAAGNTHGHGVTISRSRYPAMIAAPHRLGFRVIGWLCAAQHDALGACARIAKLWEMPVGSVMGPANDARCRGVMEPVAAPNTFNAGRRRLARRAGWLLEGLGCTASSVAESLLAFGVHGEPGNRDDAPLTSFLSAIIGADPAVASVTLTATAVRIDRHTRWRRQVTVAFPSAVEAFVEAFDAGCYPALSRERKRKDG